MVLENLLGATYIEDAHGVKSYTAAYERIVATALSTDDSLALVTRLHEGTRT
ncbi:Scr1 family TA system antitoxin-like transcriptional regulator [Kitasatospora sp. NPDC088351]|uniref:Scr1 family TA system antitoxin-like transcriptional regulator n=1 Tax=unclassified Kitasatospora TaxID=2633591 RepID=UPI003414989F